MHTAASAASQAAPGVLGFLVVAGMGVAVFFLFRSMTKHLRMVAVDPRQEPAAPGSGPPGSGPPGSAPGNGAAPGRVATGSGVTDSLANDGDSASGPVS